MKEECDRTDVCGSAAFGKVVKKDFSERVTLELRLEWHWRGYLHSPEMDMMFSGNRKKKPGESRWVRSIVIEAIAANWLTPSFSRPLKFLGLGKQTNNSWYYQNILVIHSFKRIIYNCRSFWEHEIYVPGKPLFWKNSILMITRLIGK